LDDKTDLDVLHQQLAEDLEEERGQHQKDLADRDLTTDQTPKKYRGKDVFLSFAHLLTLRSGADSTQ
jgi:myosin protein heavy chain